MAKIVRIMPKKVKIFGLKIHKRAGIFGKPENLSK